MVPSRKDMLAVAAITAALLVLACTDNIASPEAGGPAPIQTDRTDYQLHDTGGGRIFRVDIPYTYHNTTGKTIYLVNCRAVVIAGLEKRVDGRWISAWGGVYPSCLSPAIEIAAGAEFADTMIVVDYQGGAPRFSVDPIAGTYRIVVDSTHTVHNYDDSYRGGAWGDQLPPTARISNEFRLSK